MQTPDNRSEKLFASVFDHYIAWSFALVFSIVLCYCGFTYYVTDGKLIYTDTDCYTRALRIIDWLQDFQWQEKLFPYFNPAGSGFELHFTRICDVIWLILAMPFTPFMELKDAVFYGGMLFSPLFMVLSLIMVFWGLKPYLPPLTKRNTVFTLFCLICAYDFNKLTCIYDFSHPDHHSLMAFIMCACVAIILHNHVKVNFRHLFIAGILCGLGMWASSALEGLFIVCIMLTILSVNRIFYKHDGTELIYYSSGLFLSATTAWLINPPYGGYTVLDINRLSVIHATLAALILFAFLILNLINNKNKIILIASFGGMALLSAGMMLLIFGSENLFVPVYQPDVYSVFISRIIEMQHQKFYSYETPSYILGILSIAGLLYFSKSKQPYLINMLIILGYTFIAAVIYRRFFPYYMVIYGFIFGITLFLLAYGAEKREALKWFMLFYVVLPILYINAWYVNPEILKIQTAQNIKSPILTDIFDAPELMFVYGVDAVGGPYHSDIEGVLDNHNMWYATDENELKRLIKKHNVQTIFLSDTPDEEYYVKPCQNIDKLYGKIICDQNLYPWLIKISDKHYAINYGEI